MGFQAISNRGKRGREVNPLDGLAPQNQLFLTIWGPNLNYLERQPRVDYATGNNQIC